MRIRDPSPSLDTSLEFILAANQAVIARKSSPPDLGDPFGVLARELHSVACKIALVSRLRGEQRTRFDVAISALEAEFVDQGIWKMARGKSAAN
jgi:hypothetical protein